MDFLHKLHAWLDPIALRIINWLNGLVGVVMLALTAFSVLHPNFPAEVQQALGLTPVQGFAFGIFWCGLIAYVGKRAAKA